MILSKAAPGRPVGRITFHGTRADDPNDVVPHEHRRELRGYFVFAAWLNHVDAKGINSLSSLVTENGRSFIRHYLLDFGSALGSAAVGPREGWEGYEALVEEPGEIGKRALSLGFNIPVWRTQDYFESPSIGRLPRDHSKWDPEEWWPHITNAAFRHMRPDDTFWAATKLAAISDDMIRAAVAEGKFGDPASEAFLAKAISDRRAAHPADLPAEGESDCRSRARSRRPADVPQRRGRRGGRRPRAGISGALVHVRQPDTNKATLVATTEETQSPMPMPPMPDSEFIQVDISARSAGLRRGPSPFPRISEGIHERLDPGWVRAPAVRYWNPRFPPTVLTRNRVILMFLFACSRVLSSLARSPSRRLRRNPLPLKPTGYGRGQCAGRIDDEQLPPPGGLAIPQLPRGIARSSNGNPFKLVAGDFKNFFSRDTGRTLSYVAIVAVAVGALGSRRREQRLQHSDDGVPVGQRDRQLRVPDRRRLRRPTAPARRSATSKLAYVGRDIVRAQIVSQVMVQALKYTVQRDRPDHSNNKSFPSGHAASAFATATVLQRYYGWKVGVPGLRARQLRRARAHVVEPASRHRRSHGCRLRYRVGTHRDDADGEEQVQRRRAAASRRRID